jgi:peptidoglycan/xylan/chitin deacetylase (PgdA/CDA1 family)
VLSKKLRAHGKILYDRTLPVTTSSRRYQAQPVRQVLRYTANYIWLMLFRRPLVWNFSAVRESEERLRVRGRWRNVQAGTLATTLLAAYLFLWPRSSDFGRVMSVVNTREKVVALTFDDGPNGAATRAIVDILQREHVPATFFEVGRSVAADPATARYVVDHGFTIGNHSWDHSYFLPLELRGPMNREISRTSDAIVAATGEKPVYFRPPHGMRSPLLLRSVGAAGMRTVDWSVDPEDYVWGNPARITSRVRRHVRPGSIVLLHDGLQDGPRARALSSRSATIAALPGIIHDLRSEGYTFVSLQTLAGEPRAHRWSRLLPL